MIAAKLVRYIAPVLFVELSATNHFDQIIHERALAELVAFGVR